MAERASHSLSELATRFGGEVIGDPAIRVSGISSLDRAGPDDLSFLSDSRRTAELAHTRAAAVIVGVAARDATQLPRIVCDNPYAHFARVSQLFSAPLDATPGIHPSAVVDATARIAADASIGPLAAVGANVVIGAQTVIGAGCVIGSATVVGSGCRLSGRVTVYDRCVIGDRVIIHSGAVIGADGFGFARDRDEWVKIPQVGRVVIGNDVEIGANTTVDRGTVADTVIERGVKIDNLVQVAHNVVIGESTAIAGCVGIAGSARIGRHCTIAGAAGINGHVTVPDHTEIQAMTLVSRSLPENGSYSSAIPCSPSREWMKALARIRKLGDTEARLRRVEQALGRNTDKD